MKCIRVKSRGKRLTKSPFLSREGLHFCFPGVWNICVFQFYVLRLRFDTLICIAPIEELGLVKLSHSAETWEDRRKEMADKITQPLRSTGSQPPQPATYNICYKDSIQKLDQENHLRTVFPCDGCYTSSPL